MPKKVSAQKLEEMRQRKGFRAVMPEQKPALSSGIEEVVKQNNVVMQQVAISAERIAGIAELLQGFSEPQIQQVELLLDKIANMQPGRQENPGCYVKFERDSKGLLKGMDIKPRQNK